MTPPFRVEDHPELFLVPHVTAPYSWVGHIPFAFLLIELAHPRLLVELGTHSGNSYLAFCQAVAETGASTRCVAIDSWEGDEHAQFYGGSVLETLQAFHDPRYSGFSRLMKSMFDDALKAFEDESIDVLHIDGLHTYEAVRHDFETWLPKLSDRAIVLFHDTAVHERGFGVDRYFEELRQKYDGFEFPHSNGLGVLVVGNKPPSNFVAFLEAYKDRPEQFNSFFKRLAPAQEGGIGSGRVDLAPPEIECSLYYRSEAQGYDEARSVRRILKAAGLARLWFGLPRDALVDYIRIDPAALPGVYGLAGLRLLAEDGNEFPTANLADCVTVVNGKHLQPVAPSWIRWIETGQDPYVELDLREYVGGRSVASIEVTIDYELVPTDARLLKLMEVLSGLEREAARRTLDIGHAIVAINDAFGRSNAAMDGRFDQLRTSQDAGAARLWERMEALSDVLPRIEQLGERFNTEAAQLDALHHANAAGFANAVERLERLDVHLDSLQQASATGFEHLGAGLGLVVTRLEAMQQANETALGRVDALSGAASNDVALLRTMVDGLVREIDEVRQGQSLLLTWAQRRSPGYWLRKLRGGQR